MNRDDPDFRLRACVVKRAYSRAEAERVARRFRQKPYRCPFCRAYHLASMRFGR